MFLVLRFAEHYITRYNVHRCNGVQSLVRGAQIFTERTVTRNAIHICDVYPTDAHVVYVTEIAALGQVFFQVFQFSISPMLHIHSYIIWEIDNGSISGLFPLINNLISS
jgi:hypothetical protein